MDIVACVIAGLCIVVLAVTLIDQNRQHAGERRSWALERERLVHLTVARDGREFAVMRKASEPKPPEPAGEPEPLQIGTY